MKRKETIEEMLSYRLPMPVKECIAYANNDVFPICPKCGNVLEREYQAYCDRCGQKLGWRRFSCSKIKRWDSDPK